MTLFRKHKHQWSPWDTITGKRTEIYSGKVVKFKDTVQWRVCLDPSCNFREIENL